MPDFARSNRRTRDEHTRRGLINAAVQSLGITDALTALRLKPPADQPNAEALRQLACYNGKN